MTITIPQHHDLQTIRNKVLTTCRRRGLSWRELSTQTGIPAPTLFGWFVENRKIPFDRLMTVLSALDISLDLLMSQQKQRPIGHMASVTVDGSEYRIVRLPINNHLRLREFALEYVVHRSATRQ